MALSVPLIQRLRAEVGGEVIAPGDGDYEGARRIWNARFDSRPSLIARPASPGGVQTAIRFAREQQLPLAVRGGSHAPTGLSTCDDGLVIDLSRIGGVAVDPATRRARVGGGALLRELDAAGQAHGLVCPVGVVGHTGVAGLTLGGGMGRLQRRFGLTIDNLRAVELVTADGDLVRASETEEPELFWGMRGAGWNFGIVTAFELELQPFGPALHRGFAMYPAARLHELWSTWQDYARSAPDAVSSFFILGVADPPSEFPEEIAGRPIVVISYNHSGEAAAVERDLAPLRLGPPPTVLSEGAVSYLELQAANDDAMRQGRRSYINGAFTDGIEARTLDALVEHMHRAPNAECSFGIAMLGGAIGRVAPDATAYFGRDARFDMSADTSWDDPGLDEAALEWCREAMAIAAPAARPGRYANEVSEHGPEITASIYRDHLARLAHLKQAWDPENVFRLNHNVTPASVQAAR